jgi:uracil-DNA glycosylase
MDGNFEGWFEKIPFFRSSAFTDIVDFMVEERKEGKEILPHTEFILNAFKLTPPEDVKVVILGQDPYPTKGHANGLAFSVNPDVTPLPRSLRNIFRELEDDTGTNRTNGDLSDWAVQGTLLLNTSFTVVAGIPGSHSRIGWEVLSDSVVEYLSEHREHLVFILWGKHAQQKSKLINHEKHMVIQSPHPSPLSAHRGFFGSKPFSATNKYLETHGKTPIEW